VIDPPEFSKLAEVLRKLTTQRQRIEQLYLDVGMMVQRRYIEVTQTTADVIQQQAHPHTPVRCAEQTLGDQAAGDVAAVNVVLQIQTALGLVDHRQPGC